MFSASELLSATGGRFIGDVPADFRVDSAGSDSRNVAERSLFVALRGERFDGHDFLAQACAGGARCLMADKAANIAPGTFPAPVLEVADTLSAYQALGRFHRLRFPHLKVFGVTGSMGKTSVKEMLRAICIAASGPGAVLATEGNTNNQIGVVQNLLRLTDSIVYAVIEMGTSSPGEIEPLTGMALPDAAVVNSIGPCHLEKLIDFAGVAREKATIFSALGSDGCAVIPEQSEGNDILRSAAARHRMVTFGLDRGDVRGHYLGGSLEGGRFVLTFPDGARFEVAHELHGEHQCSNAAAAAAAAYSLGIAPEVIARGLTATRLPGMRMKITRSGSTTICNDAYNANPASMLATLKQIHEYCRSEELILILGDMLELGPRELEFHRAVLRDAHELFDGAMLILAGPRFSRAAEEERYGDLVFPDAGAARQYFRTLSLTDKTVLLKGSRGMHLEEVIAP